METINFSNYSFKKLHKLCLDSNIMNTEGKLFIIPEKSKWDTYSKVLKIFYNNEGSIFGNKLFTINSLIDNKDEINIDELVFPEKLAVINGKICGYTMPYIENMNLGVFLKDNSIPNEQKIYYLKQIGEILEKLKNVRNNTNIKDFYLNDLHENNFVINLVSKKLNVIDLDSCKINGNKPCCSKYLSPISPINDIEKKYVKNKDTEYLGYIVPNHNSDLYCYNVIVLNYLFQNKITRLSIEEFYVYLNYLRKIGLPYKLVDKFSKLYQYMDNENIMNYLDYITPSVLINSNVTTFNDKVLKKK